MSATHLDSWFQDGTETRERSSSPLCCRSTSVSHHQPDRGPVSWPWVSTRGQQLCSQALWAVENHKASQTKWEETSFRGHVSSRTKTADLREHRLVVLSVLTFTTSGPAETMPVFRSQQRQETSPDRTSASETTGWQVETLSFFCYRVSFAFSSLLFSWFYIRISSSLFSCLHLIGC